MRFSKIDRSKEARDKNDYVPLVSSDMALKRKIKRNADVEGVVDFIVRNRDFSEDRVRKALERMQKGMTEQKKGTTLEKWFG